MILLGIITVLLAAFIWLFLTPIHLIIDSNTDTYEVRWRGIGKMALFFVQGKCKVLLKIFFWKKWIQVEGKSWIDSKHLKRTSSSKNRAKIWRLIRSFKIKRFILKLDTDDVTWNAYLFPVSYFFNRKNRKIVINDQGEMALQLNIENSLFKILRAYLL